VSRALVIRHHEEDDAGLIGRAFADRGWSVDTILYTSSSTPLSSHGYDAVVVLGSNAAVYDPVVREQWLLAEMSFLEAASDAGVPIFGICFGAQVLCAMSGGQVRRAAEGEEGWQIVDVADSVGLPRGPWFEYHGDECVLTPEANVWATSPRAVQAFTWRQHLGVQFHPEIDAEQLHRWFQSENGSPRAHSEHQRRLLEETTSMEAEAAVRAGTLVDLFLEHAGLQ